MASLAFREQTATRLGDEVDVDIALDTEERTIETPADVAAALQTAPGAPE